MERAWWLGLSGAERMDFWLERTRRFDKHRYNLIAARHPGAPEPELMALWTDQTYRGTVPDDFLDRALAAIRAGGATLPSPD